MKPTLSIVVCTYNGGKLLEKCLNSIFSQKFDNFEVLCIDGGSTDGTKELVNKYIKKYGKIKLVHNKNRLPEGKGFGKWLGFKKSRGKIFGIVDQDNVLQRKDMFSKIVKLFEENKNAMAVTAGLKHDINDSLLVRYVSLFGTDSFFAYRSIDAIRNLFKINDDIEKYVLKSDNIFLVGSNCLFYSKKNADSVGGYDQDIIINRRLVEKNKNILFVISNATKHYSEKNLLKLATKKFMWGSNYFIKNSKAERFNYMPKTKLEKQNFYKNVIFNFLFFPNIFYSFKVYLNTNDKVAFLFPYLAFANTFAYGLNFIISKIKSTKLPKNI